jgi:hypothetical protein
MPTIQPIRGLLCSIQLGVDDVVFGVDVAVEGSVCAWRGVMIVDAPKTSPAICGITNVSQNKAILPLFICSFPKYSKQVLRLI